MEVQEKQDVTLIDEALLRLRRIWTRQLRSRKAGGDPGRPVLMSNIIVVNAVHRLSRECAEVTVGGVAEQVDVDPSTASRLVNDAIAAGLVERAASRVDARRVRLVLTEAGHRVREAVARYRREHLGRVLADWDPQEREVFARMLARFAEASIATPADTARFDRLVAEALAGDPVQTP
ncbi:DNA-binding MarR family transcriptional regulator [Thermocatellispora tengchongensis]|uniref:DNA-binding MarR family transcriptional regulator n=1 Tax=Thermocatellispora tengchongensis TaxID=1073253 RepID=A0A840PBD3_9ACTN|nr:MarR family winged helix-turn-helix transcriptional regulator [Thermocatellispora tengchongensis]MBB5136309.1 DNA-binding MarR family transcriptional regulator [Thermocatellispora tengchongensis]